jgi:hypothetical protein
MRKAGPSSSSLNLASINIWWPLVLTSAHRSVPSVVLVGV